MFIKTTALYRSRKRQSNNEKNITSIPHFRLGFSNAEDVVVGKELIMEALAAAETPFLSKVDFLSFCQLFALTLTSNNIAGLTLLAFPHGKHWLLVREVFFHLGLIKNIKSELTVSRHQAHGLRSTVLFSLVLPIICSQCTRPSKGKLPFHQLNGTVF